MTIALVRVRVLVRVSAANVQVRRDEEAKKVSYLNNSLCSSFLRSSLNAPLAQLFSKKKKKNNNFSYHNSVEYKTLIQRYSSGVRLPELCSLAKILSSILFGIIEPSREERRSFPLLIEWYHNYWSLIEPVLPYIQFRDENNQVIDGRRELIEKCLHSK